MGFSSRGFRPFRASTFHHTTSKVERGEAQQPTTGRFRQSRRRICRAEIRRTEGVEGLALSVERSAILKTMITTSCTTSACNAAQCSGFEQVQASGGAPGRGGVNPLGFSPALLRGGDGRLGRSLDPILLYYQSYHSMDNSVCDGGDIHSEAVHSRAADPDTLHFQGPAAARARSLWRSASCQLWPAPTRYSRPSRTRRRLSEVQLTSG